MKQRIVEWDLIKGFLIIMVILGHTTASFGAYEMTPFLSYLSNLTVSFIMPCFLITTGFFICNKNEIQMSYFYKKARRLLIPAILWGGITGIIVLLIKVLSGQQGLSLSMVIELLRSVKYLWYLYASFVSSVIIGIVKLFIKNESHQRMFLILIAIILHFIPTDLWNIGFAFSFILTGYFLSKSNFSPLWFINNTKNCLITVVMYLLLLLFFKYDFSIYVAGTNLLTNSSMLRQMAINGFRFIMGILGSISVTFVLIRLYYYTIHNGNNFLKKIRIAVIEVGKVSLEMYCTQFVIVEKLFAGLIVMWGIEDIFVANPYCCYFVWRHLIGIILVLLIFAVSVLIKKTFLGKVLY